MLDHRLYPLRGLPRQGQIWSWISFDVANQSFTLLINTLLFSIFFKQVVVRDPSRDDILWSIMYSVSMILTVIASPIAGAIADDRAWKKASLLVTGFTCAALTCCLGFIGPGQLWLAALLYIPANFAFSIGENFLASFLPELCAREHFGRVSGFSWGVAYFAALIILGITSGLMLGAGLKDPGSWRPLFVFAGIWFLAFAVPTLLFLKERAPAPGARSNHSVWSVGFVRLAHTLKHIRRFRDLVVLLLASVLYGTGMSVVIFFASIIASEFGFNDIDLVLFVGVITVSGVVGTLLPTLFQDRFGHKTTTVLLLSVWVITTLLLTLYAYLHDHAPDPSAFPRWPLWVLGNLLGFGLGSLGSANRAFVGYLTPESRSGEFFGIWGLVFKLSAVLTIPFALVKDLMGTTPSLLVLAGFLAGGLVVTLMVDEQRGQRAALDADARSQADIPALSPASAPGAS